MPQLFLFIFMVALLIYAIKVAILIILFAGLIFRTKETIGLIIILAIFALISAHPVISIVTIVLAATITLYKGASKSAEASTDATPKPPDKSSL